MSHHSFTSPAGKADCNNKMCYNYVYSTDSDNFTRDCYFLNLLNLVLSAGLVVGSTAL